MKIDRPSQKAFPPTLEGRLRAALARRIKAEGNQCLLAKKWGVSQPLLSRIKKGHQDMPLWMILELGYDLEITYKLRCIPVSNMPQSVAPIRGRIKIKDKTRGMV